MASSSSSSRKRSSRLSLRCFLEFDGEKHDARLNADPAEEVFEVRITSKKQVISISDEDQPVFNDYNFTFSHHAQLGSDKATVYKVSFRTGKPYYRDGKLVQREWGRVAEHRYKEVQVCRKWMPVMRRDFVQYPRLKDVYVKLKGLLRLDEFWHPAVQRRRKEIYCWEQIVPAESTERGLPSKMLRASYDYFKDKSNDATLDADIAEEEDGDEYAHEDYDGTRVEEQVNLGQFQRIPKFKISITHERMHQILQLYPNEKYLLQTLIAKRLEDNRLRPRLDQKSADEVRAQAELEFWARYFIRIHDERRQGPAERFLQMKAAPEDCYFDRPACLIKTLHAAAIEQDIVENNNIEDMDDEEEEKERRRRNEFKNEQRKIQLLKQHIVMLQEHSAMVIESTTRPPPEELQILDDAGNNVIETPTTTGAVEQQSKSAGDVQRGANEGSSLTETRNDIPPRVQEEADDAIHTQLSALRPFLPYALREVVEPPPKRVFPLILKSHTNAPVVSGAEANDNTNDGGSVPVSAATVPGKVGSRSSSSSSSSTKNNIFQVSKSSAIGILDVQRVSLEIKAARRAKELGRDSVVDHLDDVTLLQPTRKARTDNNTSKRKFEDGSWTDAMKAAQLEYLILAELQLQIDLVDHSLENLQRIARELEQRKRNAVDMHSGGDRQYFELYQRLKEEPGGLIATCIKFCNAKIAKKKAALQAGS